MKILQKTVFQKYKYLQGGPLRIDIHMLNYCEVIQELLNKRRPLSLECCMSINVTGDRWILGARCCDAHGVSFLDISASRPLNVTQEKTDIQIARPSGYFFTVESKRFPVTACIGEDKSKLEVVCDGV